MLQYKRDRYFFKKENREKIKMNYDYYDFYSNPIFNYANTAVILMVAIVLAIVLGIVLFFTFLKKNNEGKFSGFKGNLYNVLTFNRFYTENIIKFLYVIAACVITVAGLVYIVLGSFLAGACTILIGNVALRISTELVLMFIILCRKTVSVDKRLSKIENFYEDQCGEECECEGCSQGFCDDSGEEETRCDTDSCKD